MSDRPASPDLLRFDSRDYPLDEAMRRYAAILGMGAEAVATGPEPLATLEAWRMDGLILYHRRLSDIAHRRDDRARERAGFTHFTATILLEGDYELTSEGVTVRLTPGELVFADTLRTGQTSMHHARTLTLAIARSRFEQVAAPVARLHGQVLRAADIVLLRGFAATVAAALPDAGADEGEEVADVLTTLLGLALARAGLRGEAVDDAPDRARLMRFRRHVDARLADPGFDTAAAIQESGVSRAGLYRLLQGQGGLASFLRDRRLERVRRLLADPVEVRPLAEIMAVAGLTDTGNASRAFRKRYRMTPLSYRSLATGRPADDAFHKLRIWQDELRE